MPAVGGIGRAMAEALAREGWRVAIASRTLHELEAALPAMPGAIALTADVSSEAQVRAMVAQTEAQLGPLDLLVNNAGLGCLWGHCGSARSATGGAISK